VVAKLGDSVFGRGKHLPGIGGRVWLQARIMGINDQIEILTTQAKSKDQEARICDEIHRAIAERRLAPGTKLPEEALAEVFGVSRARIRKVLLLLAKENVVRLEPNRGAFVWRPSVEEARNVLSARQVVELYLVQEAARKATRSNISKLRKILKAESVALKAEDQERILRLSGDFHLALAEAAENPILSDFLTGLVSRCYLILATYQRRDNQNCPQSDHRGIVDLIENGDVEGAHRALLQHFGHIENDLDLRSAPANKLTLQDVFKNSEPVRAG
jgi:DNA-binding GntR family transcriptional regulator